MNEKILSLGKSPSVIRSLYEYGKKRKKEIGEDKVFDFSIGNPSVPTPLVVTQALQDLIANTDPVILHGYTSASGLEETKNAISEDLNKRFNANISGKYIYMTSGAASSLTITFKAILNQGDEVICFAPYFPEYKVFVENANGTLSICETDKTFHLDFDKLKSKINEKTKAIIINSPNNPTGVMYTSLEIQKLSQLLCEKSKEYNKTIYLISDEPYRELIYTDKKYPFVTNYYNDSIICYSYSKSLSLPGERIGYIALGDNIANKEDLYYLICGAGRSLGYVCASSMFQLLITKCTSAISDINKYKDNLNILKTHLESIGYEVTSVDGAFYLFVKALEEDAYKFMEIAKKFELLLVPSDSFGIKGYVRISYCVSKNQIINSLDSFTKLYNYYKEVK